MTKTQYTVVVGKASPRKYVLVSTCEGVYHLKGTNLMLTKYKTQWHATNCEGQGFGSTLKSCMNRVDSYLALRLSRAFHALQSK